MKKTRKSLAWRGLSLKQRAIPIAAIALSFCAGLGFAVRAYNNRPSMPPVSTPPTTAAGAPEPARGRPQSTRGLEAETIAIRPWGFEPDQIKRPQGRFILRVDNRSGLSEVTLQLDNETGSRLRSKTVPETRLDYREIIDLPPGTYPLPEAGNPDWACRITITP
jgi:hypothetical protein